MRFVDDPVSIAYERRVYATWHEGLVILVVALGANRRRLCAHTITGPAAPDHPWKAQKITAYEIGIDNLTGNP